MPIVTAIVMPKASATGIHFKLADTDGGRTRSSAVFSKLPSLHPRALISSTSMPQARHPASRPAAAFAAARALTRSDRTSLSSNALRCPFAILTRSSM